jgi:hypothetical protein
MKSWMKPQSNANKCIQDDNPPLTPLTPLQLFLAFAIVMSVVIFVVFILYNPLLGQTDISKNSTAQCIVVNLCTAIEVYESDFGTYPSRPSKNLVADTRYFVSCLNHQGIKNERYYNTEGDLADGEYLSPHGKPFYYTYPADGIPGPDGKIHPGVKYYLWTWGCLSKGPEAAWEINNWTPSP